MFRAEPIRRWLSRGIKLNRTRRFRIGCAGDADRECRCRCGARILRVSPMRWTTPPRETRARISMRAAASSRRCWRIECCASRRIGSRGASCRSGFERGARRRRGRGDQSGLPALLLRLPVCRASCRWRCRPRSNLGGRRRLCQAVARTAAGLRGLGGDGVEPFPALPARGGRRPGPRFRRSARRVRRRSRSGRSSCGRAARPKPRTCSTRRAARVFRAAW